MKVFFFKIYSMFEKYSYRVLAILAIITLLCGFSIYYFVYNLTFVQSIYYAISLFAVDLKTPVELGLQDLEMQKPWWVLIYFAGITALLTTLGSILEFLSVVFKEFFEDLHLKYIASDKNHIVVCGFGINNRHYVDSELKSNKNMKIIIIEKDKNNPYIDQYKMQENVGVIILSASNQSALEIAKVDACKHVIVSVGADSQNLLIVNKIVKKFGRTKTQDKIKIYLHYTSRSLEIYLNEKDIFEDHCNKRYHIEMFSYNENAARDLFINKETLTTGVNTIDSDEQVHLLIIGFGDLGQEVAVQAAILSSFYNRKKLKLTVIEKDINTVNAFLKVHVAIEYICEFSYEIINVGDRQFGDFINKKYSCPTYIVYALADDNLSLQTLLHMTDFYKRQKFLDEMKNLPFIAIRFRGELDLDLQKLYLNIKEFGKSKEISSCNMIVNSQIDKFAKELNLAYSKKPEFLKELLWSELSNFHKDSNRAAVDHWEIKKEFIIKSNIDINKLDEDIKYKLIDIEHTRWCNFHLLNGWKYKDSDVWNKEKGKETKTMYQQHKLHPCLVGTHKLKKLGKKHDEDYASKDFVIYSTLTQLEKISRTKK